MPTACSFCGATFVPKTTSQRFCSHPCFAEQARQNAANSLVARFWTKVHKTPSCWLWTASTVNGYGQFHLPRVGSAKRVISAHRFAWEITHGPIPDNLCVLHQCDRPRCCRPEHLFLGTMAHNLDDARAKGRLIDGKHRIKVDEAGILDILTNYQPRKNGKQLAAKYGITLVSLLRIVNGTQRVNTRKRPVLERVPSVQLEIRGEVA
jgi:hypothetical protein